MRNEPLTELKQVKGQSETTPGLSPNDEFANYEVFVWQLLGKPGPPPREFGSYIRQAYKGRPGDGAGDAASTPTRSASSAARTRTSASCPTGRTTSSACTERFDDTIEKRIDGATVLGLNNLWVTPAGLSAVWAEENTREAIFDAMKRKETYSTSGVRIAGALLRRLGVRTPQCSSRRTG